MLASSQTSGGSGKVEPLLSPLLPSGGRQERTVSKASQSTTVVHGLRVAL